MSLLRAAGLTKHFGGVAAVEDLSFAVEQGEILGLIGPNGSGKTTALNMLSGFLLPDAGWYGSATRRSRALRPWPWLAAGCCACSR